MLQKLKKGEKYFVLTMKYRWIYNNKRGGIFLPTNWKIKQVIAGGIYKFNPTHIMLFGMKTEYPCFTTDVDTPVGDVTGKNNYGQPNHGGVLFFNTKQEAVKKVLSVRKEIEFFNQLKVEYFRNQTMEKMKIMNNTKLKLDKLDESSKKKKQ